VAEYKEVVHERLYVKVPGGDKLRKTSAGRFKYMLAAGWRETDRWQHPEYITVKLERSGHAPTMKILPKPPPPPQRMNRGGGRGGFGGRGGGYGGRGGPGGPRGGPGGPGGPRGGPGGPGRGGPAAPIAPAAPQPNAAPAG
jgi:hypothetical protein